MSIYRGSFIRFVMPLILLVSGTALMTFLSNYGPLSVQNMRTIGFSMYTIGSFTFLIIYNHARNPLLTDDIIINISQALVLYAGLLTFIMYEQIFTIEMMVLSVTSVMIIGMIITVTIEISNL